ncbi:hypothetical protein AGMMS49525_09760 [Bacteroidia bacterium]|nr:hypothetical protein AGMMS49525_09760 [Bacteroidia bacterium]
MNYAIIAAGEGSRLAQEGIALPKPLVKVNGVALIDRLIAIFCKNNAESISIIVNEEMEDVHAHVKALQLPVPLNLVVKSTSGSMHSFFALAPFLKKGKFCLTTVDTIFKESEFEAFIRHFERDTTHDGMMAVTDFVDDEKPLWVEVREERGGGEISGFLDVNDGSAKYVSGGIYGLTPKALDTLENCMKNGVSRMRNYQRQLIADGLKLAACPFAKIVDVDHACDIKKAEVFLNTPRSDQATSHVVGVRRGNQYSPNHIGNDAAIFALVVKSLKAKGYDVTELSEDEFQATYQTFPAIFNMARDTKSIQKLQQLEDIGTTVINSGYGVENCTRGKMTKLLLDNNIPHPRCLIVQTDQLLPDMRFLGTHCWIKRSDFHAIHREDVTYARIGEEAESIIRDYGLRGIPSVVINEHLSGDLVKFYGVRGTDFFYWFYPDDLSHSKFGLEVINGKPKGLSFDVENLKAICGRTAEILNIHVYGGDCVVDKDGTIRIIDFNDWPSFAPCRNEAAPYIAKCIRLNCDLLSINCQV